MSAAGTTKMRANDFCRAFIDVIRRIAFTRGSGDAVEKYSGSELGASCGDLDAHRESGRPFSARPRRIRVGRPDCGGGHAPDGAIADNARPVAPPGVAART